MQFNNRSLQVWPGRFTSYYSLMSQIFCVSSQACRQLKKRGRSETMSSQLVPVPAGLAVDALIAWEENVDMFVQQCGLASHVCVLRSSTERLLHLSYHEEKKRIEGLAMCRKHIQLVTLTRNSPSLFDKLPLFLLNTIACYSRARPFMRHYVYMQPPLVLTTPRPMVIDNFGRRPWRRSLPQQWALEANLQERARRHYDAMRRMRLQATHLAEAIGPQLF